MAQNEDREAAKALQCWAREITTNAHNNKLRRISCSNAVARSGANGDDLETPVATRSPLALNIAPPPEKQISDLPPPPPPVAGLSLEGWLEKLAGERRKWMITLYRATRRNSKRAVDKPRQQTAQKKEPSSTEPSSTQQPAVVQAADFCHRCGSIVDVGLEIIAGGGVFVAEHRSGCSSCEHEQHNKCAINSSAEAPRSCRKDIIIPERCDVDRNNNRQSGQEGRPITPLRQRLGEQLRRASRPSLGDGQSLSPATTTGRYDRASSHNHQEERCRASAPPPVADSHPTTYCTSRADARLRGGSKPARGVSAPIGASRHRRSRSTPLWATASVRAQPLIAGVGHRKGAMPKPTGMLDTPGEERTNQRVAFSGDDRFVSSGRGVSKVRSTFEPSAGRLDRGRDRESIRAARKNVPKNGPTLLTATASHARRGDDGYGNKWRKQAEEASDNNSSITGSGQALTLGKGSPSVGGNWAEEIRMRDEQIRVLKQQLASLLIGEKPVEEMVSLH